MTTKPPTNSTTRFVLDENQIRTIMHDCAKVNGGTMKRRNDKVQQQCANLFDAGHRCIVIRPGAPFTYTYCGQKGDCCESNNKII